MNNTKPNLVIYDFCETIVSIQTADRFINYCSDSINPNSFISSLEKILIKSRFFAIINLINPKLNLSKKINLLKIRNVSELQLNGLAVKYYEGLIKPNFNSLILERLQQDIKKKNIVLIISGGYDFYLKLFCEEFGINYLLSSKIKIMDNKASGFLDGKDCMFEQKVLLLNKLILDEKLDFENTIVYSDSITDLPLFNWAKERFVISYNKSQNWVKQHNFNELIINRNA